MWNGITIIQTNIADRKTVTGINFCKDYSMITDLTCLPNYFAKITETIGKTMVAKFVSRSVLISEKILRELISVKFCNHY